ncbi:MAG: single-stranded DNA-binding protein [Dermatophilaceae bacterium]
MEEIRITAHGNVVAEPIEREGRNASIFTTFRIATTPYKRTADGKFVDGETSFFNVIAFGPLAANVASALRKGQPVIVEGTLTIRQWSADGRSGTTAEIDARHIGHDLSWGRAAFERVSRAAALGYERTNDPAVRRAVAALDGRGGESEERPDNVDEDGVIHDAPVHEPDAENVEDPALGLGDPESDDYEVVQRSA